MHLIVGLSRVEGRPQVQGTGRCRVRPHHNGNQALGLERLGGMSTRWRSTSGLPWCERGRVYRKTEGEQEGIISSQESPETHNRHTFISSKSSRP